MKTIIHILLIGMLTVGVLNVADAQRSRGGGGSSGHVSVRSGFSGARFSGPSQSSSVRSNSFANRSVTTPSSYNSFSRRSFNQNSYSRGVVTTPTSGRVSVNRIPQGYRNVYPHNNSGSVVNNNYGGRGYRGNYGSYYGHGAYFMKGPRYTFLPRRSVSIYYGGFPYYFYDGLFYSYYYGFYQPIFPPIGLTLGFLPFGYYSFYMDGLPYYYYNGIYYRPYGDDEYQVVDPPMGASVYSLPEGARAVVINGQKMYELNGTYYVEDKDANGRTIYTVVGKNGDVNNTDMNNSNSAPENNNIPYSNAPDQNLQDKSLNNTQPPTDNSSGNNLNQNSLPPASSMQIGDITNQLPEGSKVVTINGQKLYVSPDNTYFSEESVDGATQYKVVGK
jgi:Family of unknown function (DUF6515)